LRRGIVFVCPGIAVLGRLALDLGLAGLRPRRQIRAQLGLINVSPGLSHDRHFVPLCWQVAS